MHIPKIIVGYKYAKITLPKRKSNTYGDFY